MNKLTLLFVMVISLFFTISCVSKEVPVTETYYETEYRAETHSEIQDVVVGQNCGKDTINLESQWYAPHLTIGSTWPGCNGVWYFEYKIPSHSINSAQVVFVNTPSHEFKGSAYAYYIGKPSISAPPAGQWGNYLELEGTPYERTVQRWGDLPGSHELADWITEFNSRISSARYLGGWEYSYFAFEDGHIDLYKTPQQKPFEFNITNVTNLAVIVCGADFQFEPVQAIKLTWCDNITEKRPVAVEVQIPYEVEKQRTVMQIKQVPFWEAIFH